ncbi:hypothetical protein DPMN_084265 [Dreissena polymorpha]|uniref:Uncharacterized protein n=1 Tax=Dreissena polymorpha TaxID=45954 RepID=A0A9D4BKP7_DREPO|nr:hypothetical protein DPMN_084265 [Dreissena polymorpha]
MKARRKVHCYDPRHGHIAFVESGETKKTKKPTKASVLDGTRNWKMTLVEGLLSQTWSDDPTTRYCTVVRDRKEAHHHRADSTMGGKM